MATRLGKIFPKNNKKREFQGRRKENAQVRFFGSTVIRPGNVQVNCGLKNLRREPQASALEGCSKKHGRNS